MKDDDVVSLREFFLVHLRNLDERIEGVAKIIEDRTVRAEIDINRRLDEMNRFRHQLETQAATFLSREYYDAQHLEIRRRIEGLEQARSNLEGRLFATGAIIGIVLVVIQVVLHWFR